MEVKETRNIQDVLECVPFECQIREKGRDRVTVKDMLYFTAQGFANDPSFRFFIFYEQGRIVGYVALRILFDKYERGVHIIRVFKDKNFPEVLVKLEELLTAICTHYKLDRIIGRADSPSMKKYMESKGFTTAYTVMQRRV